MRETWVPSLGWEDPLEKGKTTHFSVPAWRILLYSPWGHQEFDTTEWLLVHVKDVKNFFMCLLDVFLSFSFSIIWVSSYHRTTYWDIFLNPIKLPCFLCWKSINWLSVFYFRILHSDILIYLFVLMPISLCLDHCSFWFSCLPSQSPPTLFFFLKIVLAIEECCISK